MEQFPKCFKRLDSDTTVAKLFVLTWNECHETSVWLRHIPQQSRRAFAASLVTLKARRLARTECKWTDTWMSQSWSSSVQFSSIYADANES